MPSLVWFRSDLRTNDHPALYHAATHGDGGVIGAFVACPKQWRQHDWGFPRVDFVLRNLTALSASLERLNIPLLYAACPTFREVPDVLLTLARRHRCTALFFNDEYEVNERRRDEAVAACFAAGGLSVYRFTDQTLFSPGDIRTGQGSFFTVFTPYRRAWLRKLQQAADGLTKTLPAPSRQPVLLCRPSRIPKTLSDFQPNTASPAALASLWPDGEAAARKRLTAFVERRIESYAQNRDCPAVDGTSRLSPYLAAGVISARSCLRRVRDAGIMEVGSGPSGPGAWINELIWREFYRHVVVGFPRVSMGSAFRIETDRLEWSEDPQRFTAWCEGRTGFPIVDAAMRQLARTGWMHNRLRMIVAMFLTKDLLLDWRLGERFFMQHLIDGDLASNNGGWQWAASTGTDAAPYFRIFNPVSQSRRFDPNGEFIRQHLPELRGLDSRSIHDPSCLPAQQRAAIDYPHPICNHAESRAQIIRRFKALRRPQGRRS